MSLSLSLRLLELMPAELIEKELEANPDLVLGIKDEATFLALINYINLEKLNYDRVYDADFLGLLSKFLPTIKLKKKFNPNHLFRSLSENLEGSKKYNSSGAGWIFWHLIVDRIVRVTINEDLVNGLNDFINDKMGNFTEPINPNVKDAYGYTYLHKYCIKSNLLTYLQPDPLIKDNFGRIPQDTRCIGPLEQYTNLALRELEEKKKAEEEAFKLKIIANKLAKAKDKGKEEETSSSSSNMSSSSSQSSVPVLCQDFEIKYCNGITKLIIKLKDGTSVQYSTSAIKKA